jgi:hypothetical protein
MHRMLRRRPRNLSGGSGYPNLAQASLRVVGDGRAGIEPLPEHAGVRLQEDVQDLLARVRPTSSGL